VRYSILLSPPVEYILDKNPKENSREFISPGTGPAVLDAPGRTIYMKKNRTCLELWDPPADYRIQEVKNP